MRAAARLSLLAAAGVLLTVTLFFGGGSGDERLFWIGWGVVLVALCTVTASLVGWLPSPAPTRAGTAALVLLGAFVAWNGLTIWWSIAGDRSWSYLNRGLVYAAFAVVGLYVGSLVPKPARVVAGALALLLGGVALWALAGKVVPALFPDGARVARLRNPVGYWNALALLAAVSLPLFLWVAARRRAVGAVGFYLAAVATLLTYSRGGVGAALVAVSLWLALDVARRESLSALAVSVPVALAVSGIGLALPGVAKDLQPHSERVEDGAWFGLALVAGAALVGWLAGRALGRVELRALAAVAVALVAVGIGALVARGDWLAGFRGSDTAQVTSEPGRLTSASSNNRWTWWQEAWQIFEREPAGGKGARTFEIARRPLRSSAIVTTEPHNVALQFLSETGIVGFLLGAAAALAALLAAADTVRRLGGAERSAATALAIALPVYLLHALADIDWDFVAVSGFVFFVLGVLGGGAAPPRASVRRPVLALATALFALAALYSLTAPWLAGRRVDAAYEAIGRNDLTRAVADARSAHGLNPLSPEPLYAWALADHRAGDRAGALAEYRFAVDRQPENSDTWYNLGAYEFEIGRYGPAYRDLNQAYTLDRYGPAGERGGLLDQARAKVNAGLG